jgi:hypothetical protein
MYSESVCHVARSWVDVGSFHTRLFGVVYFDITSVREFTDTPSYLTSLEIQQEKQLVTVPLLPLESPDEFRTFQS